MSDAPRSILLAGGRVIDPATGFDATADVLVEVLSGRRVAGSD